MGLRDLFLEYSTRLMRSGWALKYQYSVHTVMDALLDSAEDANRAATGRGNSEALAELGRDRGLSRSANENDADFHKRVQLGWVSSRKTASAGQIARDVSLALWDSTTGTSPRVTVLRQRDTGGGGVVHTVSDGISVETRYVNGTWDWDRDTAKWWRVWIHIETTGLASVPAPTWGGGGTWGDGSRWGIGLTGTQLLSVLAAVRNGRAAHGYIPFLMLGPAISPTADYGTLLSQLQPGAIVSGTGQRSVLVPYLGGYLRQPIGLAGQTVIDIDDAGA